MRRIAAISLSLVLFLSGVYTASLFSPRARAQSTYAPIQCNQSVAISSATSVQIVTAANANMRVVVCNVSLGSIGGSSFSIVEGTGSVCATNIKAMGGGTTAAAGWGIAANGSPVQFGSGLGPVMSTQVLGDNVCLIVAGTGPLAGTVAFEQQSY
jgi:hypothetical protein